MEFEPILLARKKRRKNTEDRNTPYGGQSEGRCCWEACTTIGEEASNRPFYNYLIRRSPCNSIRSLRVSVDD